MNINSIKNKYKSVFRGLLVFSVYVFITFFKNIPIQFLGFDKISDNYYIIYNTIISFFLIIIISFIYKDTLKNNYYDLLKNHKEYFKKYLKYWLAALFFMALFNLIFLNFMPNTIPKNEEIVREIFQSNPFIMFITAVIFAPIIEELVFRQSFRDIFSNDILFVFMSAFIFSSFHVIGTLNSYIELLYLIPYAIPAIAFSLILIKTQNIFVPIGFHFLHNGILISLQFILLFFG